MDVQQQQQHSEEPKVFQITWFFDIFTHENIPCNTAKEEDYNYIRETNKYYISFADI